MSFCQGTILGTTVGNSVVSVLTHLWRHLTYDFRGAWHTVYAMLPLNYK